MNWTLFPAIATAALVLGAQTGRGDLVQVKAVRHYPLAEATRVVIEVSGEFTYHTERLHNPERVFFDIFNSRPLIESKRLLNRELEDKLLQRIRVAETLPGVTRIVLDLRDPVEETASQLANPHRLVVELRGKEAPIPSSALPSPAPTPQSTAAPASPAPAPVVINPGSPKVGPPRPAGPAGTTVASVEPPPKKEVPAPGGSRAEAVKSADTPGKTVVRAGEPARTQDAPRTAKTEMPARPAGSGAEAAKPAGAPAMEVRTEVAAAEPSREQEASAIAKNEAPAPRPVDAAGNAAVRTEVPAAQPSAPARRSEIVPVKPMEAPKPAAGSDVPAVPGAAPITEPGKAARPTTSAGKNSLIRALGLKVTRVVLDPGHGGNDQGTVGPKGLVEKELVLDVAKRLGKLIEDRLGAEVIYTRTDDTFVPLEGRTALANERKADLFLSIHANSSPLPRIAGVETFYLNFTDSKDALDVASRENASSQKSIFELRDIISKITLHDKAEESREFAGRIQASLFAFSARSGIASASKNRGVKKAPFVVLIGATMPSVLAEIGFISNTREEANLKRPDYRQKLAEAIFRGMSRYADSLSHFQVAATSKGD